MHLINTTSLYCVSKFVHFHL